MEDIKLPVASAQEVIEMSKVIADQGETILHLMDVIKDRDETIKKSSHTALTFYKVIKRINAERFGLRIENKKQKEHIKNLQMQLDAACAAVIDAKRRMYGYSEE